MNTSKRHHYPRHLAVEASAAEWASVLREEIRRCGTISLSEAAKLLDVSEQAASARLWKLEAAGVLACATVIENSRKILRFRLAASEPGAGRGLRAPIARGGGTELMSVPEANAPPSSTLAARALSKAMKSDWAMALLAEIKRRGSTSRDEAATFLGVSYPTAKGCLEKCEAAGLVLHERVRTKTGTSLRYRLAAAGAVEDAIEQLSRRESLVQSALTTLPAVARQFASAVHSEANGIPSAMPPRLIRRVLKLDETSVARLKVLMDHLETELERLDCTGEATIAVTIVLAG